MKKKNPNDLLIVLLVLLAALLGLAVFLEIRQERTAQPEMPVPRTEAAMTDSAPGGNACPSDTEAHTEPSTEPPTEPPTEPATEPPTEPPTEPQPQRFTITLVGDCTFGCNKGGENRQSAFPLTVGDDYGYPFRNVLEYFEKDDYSLINLEGVLGDKGTARYKEYRFRGSAEYTRIMTENSIEGVTLANNHSEDYGEEGYAETKRLLDEADIAYVEHMSSTIVTTDSGLTIGLFAADLLRAGVDHDTILDQIRQLKEQNAELVVCALHWGTERVYAPSETQKNLAHKMVDAGADIIWGHHPHVLQPIEEYNGGIIFYSLGNFAFGGNAGPKDLDTALVQQEVIRDPDGTVTLGELTVVPCSVSSVRGYNNFQPTPYEMDTELYRRVLRKLDLETPVN